MNAERTVFVYTTYPSLVEAERIGKAVLERRLAACVNILPGMVSHYWWEGKIERGEEVVMIIKTRASLADGVRAAVKELHPYDTPAILVLPIEGGEAGYIDWLMKETEKAKPRTLCPARDAARSGASQMRDPGFFEAT